MNKRFIAILSIATIIGVYFLITIVYGFNFPIQDDYNVFLKFILDYNKCGSLHQKVALLFHQTWEHRIFFPKFSALAEYLLTGKINFLVLILLGNAGLLVLFWILYNHFCEPATISIHYFIPPVLIIFNLSYYELSLWSGAALANIWATVFGILSLSLLFRGSNFSFILSLFFAWLATFSYGNGIAVFLVGFIVLGLNNKLFTYKGLLLALSWFLCIKTYFYHYTFMHHFNISEFTNTGNLKAIIRFGFVFMGRCFSGNAAVAFAGGIILVALFLFATYKKLYKGSPELYSYLLFILGTAAITALGRYHSGLAQALCVRYALFPSIFLAIFYILILINYPEKIKPRQFLVIVVCCLAFNLVAFAGNIRAIIDNKRTFTVGYAATVSGKISDFSYEFWPGDKTVPQQILKASDSVNLFNFKFTDQKTLLEKIPYSDTAKLEYKTEDFSNATAVKFIEGWCTVGDENADSLSIFIVVRDSENRDVKFIIPQLISSKHSGNKNRKEFLSEFDVNDLKPGNYSVVLLATNSRFKEEAIMDKKILITTGN